VTRERVVPAIVSVVLVGAVLAPLLRDPIAGDSFPLSTFPMFAVPRPARIAVSYPIGETADGQRRTLGPALVGTGEVLQALAIVDDAVHGGNARRLCEAIAARVAADPDRADVAAVRIVTGLHDAVALVTRGTLGFEAERVRCAVSR
jgi:hypothetical protein